MKEDRPVIASMSRGRSSSTVPLGNVVVLALIGGTVVSAVRSYVVEQPVEITRTARRRPIRREDFIATLQAVTRMRDEANALTPMVLPSITTDIVPS